MTRYSVSRLCPGPFADNDLRRPGRPECDSRADDDERIRVDRRARFVLHHVRLQEHALAAHIHAKLPKPPPDHVAEIHVVPKALRTARRSSDRQRGIGWDRSAGREHPTASNDTGMARRNSRRVNPNPIDGRLNERVSGPTGSGDVEKNGRIPHSWLQGAQGQRHRYVVAERERHRDLLLERGANRRGRAAVCRQAHQRQRQRQP